MPLILVSQNETTKKNHARTEVIVIHGVKDAHTPCYGPLNQALKKDNFDVIFINEFAPSDPKHTRVQTSWRRIARNHPRYHTNVLFFSCEFGYFMVRAFIYLYIIFPLPRHTTAVLIQDASHSIVLYIIIIAVVVYFQ